jgi:hypothetical protein
MFETINNTSYQLAIKIYVGLDVLFLKTKQYKSNGLSWTPHSWKKPNKKIGWKHTTRGPRLLSHFTDF